MPSNQVRLINIKINGLKGYVHRVDFGEGVFTLSNQKKASLFNGVPKIRYNQQFVRLN